MSNKLELTLKTIHDRCDEVGECWIWKDAVGQHGYPIIRRRPGGCLLVRRVAVALDGRPAAPRQPVACTCNEKRCCNPAHLKPSSPKAIGKAAAARGSFASKSRAAKIAAGKRSSGSAKLTMEQVREIRLSEDSGPVLAERYGVNRSLIGGIRRGTAWRDYSNPFAGLMGMGR